MKYLFFLIMISLTACYSFRGGSLPEHIKTVQVKSIVDNSGYGNPKYKETLYNKVIEKIRNDNSLLFEEKLADSRLTITINSIREETSSTGLASQLEKERKITVSVSMEFYDNVKKRVISQNANLNINQIFQIASAPASRDEAVNQCIDILSEEILNSMIAGG